MSANRIQKLFKLTFADWLLLAQCFYFLALSKRKIKFLTFQKVAPTLGNLNQDVRFDLTPTEYAESEKIRLFTMRASRLVPWRSVCMDQAMTGIILLKKKHIPCTLYMGVRKKDEGQGLDAHAWVVCGDKIVLGGQKSLFYTVTARFANDFTTAISEER